MYIIIHTHIYITYYIRLIIHESRSHNMLQAIIHFPNDFGWSKWCHMAMISDRRRKLSGKWLQQGTQSEQRGTPKFISYLLLVVIISLLRIISCYISLHPHF